MRHQLDNLDVSRPPLFCGRDDFFDLLDRLLDPSHSLKVLVVTTTEARVRHGGSRLLRELSAAAFRAGTIPVYPGPFATDAPTTFPLLVGKITARISRIRRDFGLGDWPARGLRCCWSSRREPTPRPN